MSRDELLVVVGRQAGQLAEQAEQIAARDRQIAGMAGQLAELLEVNEALAAKLARLEHLLSRNSGNSSSPLSRDDDPGKLAPPEKKRSHRGSGRARGANYPGRRGRTWRGPTTRTSGVIGSCRVAATEGDDLSRARDLGVVDRYRSHE